MKIAIAGLGTVGGSVAKILIEDNQLLHRRSGKNFNITSISARSKSKKREFSAEGFKWVDNPLLLAEDKEVDVVVELIGGAEGVAKELAFAAISNGKHFVTANKALIATHGVELAKLAREKKVALMFEAAVAGGIPVIKSLREGLAANEVSWLAGILNGTCNYILTEMEKTRRDFADVLKEAQELGYAEADPSFDIDGIDTAQKLAILASIAFGSPVDFASVYVEGIRHISLADIDFASSLGYKIKLLGICGIIDGKLAQTVHPVMVKSEMALASVDGAYNAIEISGSRVGRVVLEGRGAGGDPTASAVVADLVDIARGNIPYPFGVPVEKLVSRKVMEHAHIENAYYIRLKVLDRPGVVAEISSVMRDNGISIESLHQRSRKPDQPVNIVMSTHMAKEQAIKKTLEQLEKLESVMEKPVMIRIVDL